jgi:hypothetical protein
MDDLECQLLPADSINEAAKVIVLAFSDSPAYNFIFQGDLLLVTTYRRRREAPPGGMDVAARRNLSLVQRRRPSVFRGVVDAKGETVACFLWTLSSLCGKKYYYPLSKLFGISTLERFLLEIVKHLDQGERYFSAQI